MARFESSSTLLGCMRIYTAGSGKAPPSLSNVGMPERRHRVRDHLEQPRWQRGERRSELGAAIGRGIGWRQQTPLARKHHGDEHLGLLHTGTAVSIGAIVAVLRLCAMGCTCNRICQCGESYVGSTR